MTILTDGLYMADVMKNHAEQKREIANNEASLLEAAHLLINFQYDVIKNLEEALMIYYNEDQGDDLRRVVKAATALNLIRMRTDI